MKGIWTPIHRCLHSLSSSRAKIYFKRSNGKQLSEILITTVNARVSLTKRSPNGLTKVIPTITYSKKQSAGEILVHVHTSRPECREPGIHGTTLITSKAEIVLELKRVTDLGEQPVCHQSACPQSVSPQSVC